MKVILRSGLLLLSAACAHVEPPPGGPEDRTPPAIAATAPMADSIVPPFDSPVVIQFNERISQERIEDAISVSPRTSPVQVSNGRSSVRVSLRNGWEAGQVYHVTVDGTLRDLFGNALSEAATIVFSTGPEIPDTRLEGIITDRLTGRPVADARVEAIRSADSLVYAVKSDTAGAFVIERFPTGAYRVRAYPDANRNRSLEFFEASDSAEVTIAPAEPVLVALNVLAADSTSPAVTDVEVDSLILNVEFDDHLDPEQEVTIAQVAVTHPTAGAVGVDSARVRREEGPPGTGALLPSRTLEVFLTPGVVLDPSTEYEIGVTSIRNINGLSGDSEDTFEAPEPPEPADIPAAGAPAARRDPDIRPTGPSVSTSLALVARRGPDPGAFRRRPAFQKAVVAAPRWPTRQVHEFFAMRLGDDRFPSARSTRGADTSTR